MGTTPRLIQTYFVFSVNQADFILGLFSKELKLH